MIVKNQAASDEQHLPQLSERYYQLFRELVLEASGLYFSEKKRFSLEAGVLKAFKESGIAPDLDSYYRLLGQGHRPEEMERLINALTVNETHFFRDEAQFRALRHQILPALIQRKRAIATAIGPEIQPQLRIWCAGCATGEEPYSLAILLKELLPDLAAWQLLILGTDINRNSLAAARQGSYSDWSFREAEAKVIQGDYFSFDYQSRRYQLHEEIRHLVHFAPLNLVKDQFPAISNNTSNMDLILCRNVTIYFTPEITQQIITRFYDALVEEGWLIVGHAEPSPEIYREFQPHTFPGTLTYQKKYWSRGGLASPNGHGAVPEPLPPAPLPEPAPVPSSALEVVEVETQARQLLAEGRDEAALALLQQQLQRTPQAAPLHALLCRAYANRGEWLEAEVWGRSALKLDPLLSEVYYTLALVYEHQQQLEAALAMLKKVIYLDREAPLPQFHLAMLYQNLGRTAEAGLAWQTLISLLSNWPPDKVVPDSGGETARNLLRTAQRLMGRSK